MIRTAVLIAALALVAGCRKGDAPSAPAAEGGVAPTAKEAAPRRPVTTSSSIALGNLSADIDARSRKDDKAPAARLALVELLLARGQVLAKTADIERAAALAKDALAAGPETWQAHMARALALGALHEFDASNAALDEAAKRGAAADRVDEARFANLVAVGRYDDAKALQSHRVATRDPTVTASAAALAGRMQNVDEAERLFELARTRYRDVSPFPLAWMDFQRASVLEAAGRDGRAWYAEACDVIPEHAHAAVHLAVSDPPGKAVGRLERLRTTSDDPDVLAALAAAYARVGRKDDASRTLDDARKRYGEVVAAHRPAFADHAARFYLGAGADPRKALELAKDNAARRPTEEAVDLWSAAAAAVASDEELCASARAMRALRYVSPRSRKLADAALARCSD